MPNFEEMPLVVRWWPARGEPGSLVRNATEEDLYQIGLKKHSGKLESIVAS